MRLGLVTPNARPQISAEASRYRADLRQAAIIATDKASRNAQRALKAKIRSVGLGRLGGAVGQTSTLRKGDTGRDPYGAIFARGSDESLAGGALESYSRGSVIRAQQKQWLAFQTRAIPRRIGRYRTTPERYNASGLANTIGKLVFKPLGPNRAILVVKRVTVHPKTGRAQRAGKRPPRTRIPQDEIVAFVLIRVTRRAQRFDKDHVVFVESLQIPAIMEREMAKLARAA